MLSLGLACPACGPTGEKSTVHIGTELLLHGTSHTVRGLRAMPAQRPYVPWLYGRDKTQTVQISSSVKKLYAQ